MTGQYELPVYAVSPDGRWAVSLNFARIPRRGYSYADAVLPAEQRHPDLDNDGIFLLDLHSGSSRLLFSYRRIEALHPVPYELGDMYWWLNHAIFNCDSSKLLFLFRCCPDPLHPGRPMWKTFMYTVNLDGSDPACTLPQFYWDKMISHQIWGRTPHEVLIDANWRGKGFEYVVFDDRVRRMPPSRILPARAAVELPGGRSLRPSSALVGRRQADHGRFHPFRQAGHLSVGIPGRKRMTFHVSS